MKLTEVKASTACSPSRLPGIDYALNPYRGCGHGCVYCYAPDVLRMDNSQDWGNFVEVRKNIPVLLAKQKKKLSGIIGLGTVTDPYQQAEEKYKVTRYCLEQLAASKLSACIQTKSDLIVRDIDILQRMNVEVIFTINTMDKIIARKIEPRAPSPERRLEALRQISDAGIKTWVFLGPVIPRLNDSPELLKDVVQQVKKAGASKLMYDRLRLKPFLEKRLRKLFGHEKAREVFKLVRDKKWDEKISLIIEIACDDAGLVCDRAF